MRFQSDDGRVDEWNVVVGGGGVGVWGDWRDDG